MHSIFPFNTAIVSETWKFWI